MNKYIKFGASLIDISKIQSIGFSVNPNHKLLDDNHDNNYYYVLGIFFNGEQVPRTYCGSKNDVYEVLFKLEDLGFIDNDVINNFEEYVNRLDEIAKDYDNFNAKNMGLN